MDQHGKICWNELNTWDTDKARAFYTALLGWHFDEMPMPQGTYLIAKAADGSVVGGVFDMAHGGLPKEIPPHWFTYIAVDDVDARVQQTTEAGGSVMRPPWDIAGVGRMAVIRDASGAALALMTPVPKASP